LSGLNAEEQQPAAENRENPQVIVHAPPPDRGREPQSVRDAWDRMNGWQR
jgi:hypothetical protein